MKNVMTIAWEIAKEAVTKFGGKVKEYFAQSLKMAWAQVKNVTTTSTLVLQEGTRNSKTWVAEINGVGGKFGFDRKFVNGAASADSYAITFEIEAGKYYEVNNYRRQRTCKRTDGSTFVVEDVVRTFIQLVGGAIVELDEYDVKAALV